MKKILSNIHMLAALLMAGAAMTACSGSDELIDNPDTKTYTVTVEATKSADPSTRALTGGTGTSPINFTWTDADQVEVYDATGYYIGTLTPQTVGSTTTKLKGTINTTYLSANDKLHLFLRTSNRLCDYTGQDGTLAKIGTNYDFAHATNIKVTAVEESNITLEPATFSACQAIVKFKLVDTDNKPVNATSFNIVSQEDNLWQTLDAYSLNKPTKGNISVTLSTATDEFYVALAQYYNGGQFTASSKFILSAVAGSDTYIYMTSDKKMFEAGKYYTVTVKMSKVGAGKELSTVTTDDIGKVIGEDGKVYDSVALATAASGSAVAMIGSISSTGHGLALELNCHYKDDYTSLESDLSSLTPIGGTWRIPSLGDLQTIFQGCGAPASVVITSTTTDCETYKDVEPYLTGFWTKLVACGASNSIYWFDFITSSDAGTGKHWCVEIKEYIKDVNYYAYIFSKGSKHYLHCVLAF